VAEAFATYFLPALEYYPILADNFYSDKPMTGTGVL